MSSSTLPVLSTAALGLLYLVCAPPAQELSARVAQGTKIVREFEQRIELELEESRVVFNGEDQSGEGSSPDLELTGTKRIVLTDHYREVDERRPTLLVRTFDELSAAWVHRMSFHGEVEEDQEQESSRLEHRTVAFAWDGERNAYRAKYQGGRGGEDLLGGLEALCDLRAFLPGKEVAEGDSWEVAAAAFDGLFSPGGELGISSEDADPTEVERHRQMRANFKGAITATYKGTREEGGVSLAVIQVECELATHAQNVESEDGVSATERVELELEVAGELLWDPEAGHLHSCSLEGPQKVTMRSEATGEQDGEPLEYSQHVVLRGSMALSARFRRAD